MSSSENIKRLSCLFLCCSLVLAAACGQGVTPQQATAASAQQAAKAANPVTYQFSADIVKSDASIGVNAEWNDRFLVMVILDNDHSKSYTSGDEILYLDQMDLLAQRETLHSVLAFPAGSLAGKEITAESGDLLLLLGGNYALSDDASSAADKACVMPMSFGMDELGNSLDVSLYSRDDASESGVAIEEPVFTSGVAELIGIPEAGSKIECSVPIPDGADADDLRVFLAQYDGNGALLSFAIGTVTNAQLTVSGVVDARTAIVKAIVANENLLPLTAAKTLRGAEGGIRLESEPAGAEVWVGGKFMSVTPCTVVLPAGDYAVQLKIPGYEDTPEIPVTVTEGLTSVPDIPRLVPDLPEGSAGDTITVTGQDDVMDGDTSGITALQHDPGKDGKISLREAVAAANAAQDGNLRTIRFAPELKDQTIRLSLRSDRLGHDVAQFPLVLFDHILIDGDIEGDGIPDVTISAPDADACAFFCWASDITFASLRFSDCYRAIGIQPGVAHTPDNQLAKNIESLTIVNCVFTQKADEQRSEAAAIQVTGIWNFDQNEKKVMLDASGSLIKLTQKSNFSDFSVSNLTIAGNDISYEIGIWIMGGGALMGHDNDRIVFHDFDICANRIELPNASGNAFAAVQMYATDCNNAYDGPPLDNPNEYIYSDGCRLEDILFRGNTVVANRGMSMLLSSANMGNSENAIKSLNVEYNRFETYDTSFACITAQIYNGNQYGNARVAEGNRFEKVSFNHNEFLLHNAGPAIDIGIGVASSGKDEPSSRNNWFTDLTIENNDIQMIDSQEESSAIRISAAQNCKESLFVNSSYGDGLIIRNNTINYIGCFQYCWDVKTPDTLKETYGAIALFGARTGVYDTHLTTTAIASGNYLRSVIIEGNVVTGAAISLYVVGGFGNNATNNSVQAVLKNNVFTGEILSFDNAMNAADNQIILTGQ